MTSKPNNNTHKTHVRPERRRWSQQEYRAVCNNPSCGWTEKAIDFGTAERRGKDHEMVMKNPNLYRTGRLQ